MSVRSAASSTEAETQPLLPDQAEGTAESQKTNEVAVSIGTWIKLVVALAGKTDLDQRIRAKAESKLVIFLAHADSSLVIATYGQIASSFDASAEASWLLTSFLMGYTVALPIVGRAIS